MKQHYSTEIAVLPSKSPETRKMTPLFLSSFCINHHGRCDGLRAAGYNSDVTVSDAITGAFKRTEPPLTYEQALRLCKN